MTDNPPPDGESPPPEPEPAAAPPPTVATPVADPGSSPGAISSEAGAPPRVSTAKSWIIAGLVTAVVALGVVLGVTLSSSKSKPKTSQASTFSQGDGQARSRFGPAGARGAIGKITAIDGRTLELDDSIQQGGSTSTTVKTTSQTTFTRSVTGKVSDVEVGDHVTATGSDSNGVVAATRLVDDGTGSAPQFRARRQNGTNGQGRQTFGSAPSAPNGQAPPAMAFATGTVTSVDGNKIVIKDAQGRSKTITTSSSTTVTVVRSATLADMKVGDTVMVTGKRSGSTVTATTVREGDGGFGGPQFGLRGSQGGGSQGPSSPGSGAQGSGG